jgi:hypothetical protein
MPTCRARPAAAAGLAALITIVTVGVSAAAVMACLLLTLRGGRRRVAGVFGSA